MAVKRVANIFHKHATDCLNCGQPIPRDKLVDDTTYQCERCGTRQTIDRCGNVVYLTREDHAELRRRYKPEDAPEEDEVERMKAQLEELRQRARNGNPQQQATIDDLRDILRITVQDRDEARKQAAEWKEAAEGLARLVEEMKQEHGEI